MPVKHLVISAGGIGGLSLYGVLKILHKKNVWNLKNIQNIYGCSIGGVIAIILSLGLDWSILDDYFIKRPWDTAFFKDTDPFSEIYNGGIDIEYIITIMLKTLFEINDIDINISFKEFYNKTKINICLVSTDINKGPGFRQEIISKTTYPDLPIIKGAAMSCCIPLIFKPIFYKDKCMIDGGFYNYYPNSVCIRETNARNNEILGIRMNLPNTSQYKLNEESSKFDMIKTLLYRANYTIDSNICNSSNHLEIVLDDNPYYNNLFKGIEFTQSASIRKEILECGESIAKKKYQEILNKIEL